MGEVYLDWLIFQVAIFCQEVENYILGYSWVSFENRVHQFLDSDRGCAFGFHLFSKRYRIGHIREVGVFKGVI